MFRGFELIRCEAARPLILRRQKPVSWSISSKVWMEYEDEYLPDLQKENSHGCPTVLQQTCPFDLRSSVTNLLKPLAEPIE